MSISSAPVPRRRGFSPWRDLPVLGWLLAVVLSTLVHPWVPEPRWLMLHLLLLGAVTHAIVVWSQYFTDALLHTRVEEPALRARSRRLALLTLGTVAVVVGTQVVAWPLTVAGATAVTAAVTWHALALAAQLRHALPARFGAVVRYYVTAALLLPVGAVLGVLLARGLADPWHARVLLAHTVVNLLGWVGLTVAGTLLTLWPTMLRTRLGEGSDTAIRRGLPVLAAGVLVAAGGALAGLRPALAAGLILYAGGLAVVAVPLARATRRTPPSSFPAWSVGAGLVWWAVLVPVWAGGVLLAGDWGQALDHFRGLAPFLAAGFAAQVLLGALSHLVPSALGGGPSAVRAATAVTSRGGAARVVATNAGLVLCALPVPSLVRVLCSLVVLVAMAATLPLLVAAIRTSRRVRTEVAAAVAEGTAATRPTVPLPAVQRGRVLGAAAAGLAAVVLAVAAGAALDPAAVTTMAAPASAAGDAAATGETTTVEVVAEGMRFTPDVIDVPAGNRLVVEITNAGDDVHDLVFETGADSGHLAPGDRATIDVGVVGRDLDGWCSVVGHRQMGMTLEVRVVSAGSTTADGSTTAEGSTTGDGSTTADGSTSSTDGAHDHGGTDGHAHHAGTGEPASLDPMAEPGAGFAAPDAVLPPLGDERVRRVTMTVSETEVEVAPGVTQTLWTYNGSAPGPTLHGRVGDRFVVTLVNDGSIGHSIDFHAGALAPDRPMRTIQPGESLTYRFTATRAGIWMYHCSTMPMSTHIANGMFGAVVIEPAGLPAVDRSYLLVQSEMYYGPQSGPVDADKLAAESPDAVVFNGYAFGYDHDPLPARVGERVRVWVLDAGPNRPTSFHVVGGQFDTTWAEGDYLLRDGGATGDGGAQSLGLQAAQGGFVELAFPEAGHYPFVSHVMVDAERGAHGTFAVTR
ncbi:multicopper oxidase domain-containing protein [Nocardioides ferulae]|uniref:multicopper oxidase domain-containing protein n=1 Tax=Nocardioides ferulae TaxID=2340821 RepID=UPI000EB0382B|nr:multicopper oxidase domain-containing protein [Nocardioides ferulae]